MVERGPEYLIVSGHFEIHDFAQDSKTVTLRRFVDMSKEGWWSGDLEVHRPRKEIELLMLADDLHVAELVTWSNLKDLTRPARAGKPAGGKTSPATAPEAGATPPGAAADAPVQPAARWSRLPTSVVTARWPVFCAGREGACSCSVSTLRRRKT